MPVDLHISVSLAADGPIPGPYSMLSLAMTTAGTFDGTTFTAVAPTTFHRELQPVSADFVPEALALSGLDRAGLARTGTAPALAMPENVAWVDEQSARYGALPVLVSRRLGHDWMFTHWYQQRFAGRSPFGPAAHLDLLSLYAHRARRPVTALDPADLTAYVLGEPRRPMHTLEEALEQAELLRILLQ